MREAEHALREMAAEREAEIEGEAQRGRRVRDLTIVDERLHERLAGIDRALARLRRGEFGLCVDCEEPIPAARLEAVPSAERCIECAERLERRLGVRRSNGASWTHPLAAEDLA